MTGQPGVPPGEHDADDYYPEFATVRRGYDPVQVDQVLDDLYASLDDAVQQAEQEVTARLAAERALASVQMSLEATQRRVVELERSGRGGHHEAQALRDEAAQVLRDARAEADAYRDRARRELAAVREQLTRVQRDWEGSVPGGQDGLDGGDDLG